MGGPLLCILLAGTVLMGLLVRGPRSGPSTAVLGALLTMIPAVLMSVILQQAQQEPLSVGRRGLDNPWRVTLTALRFPLAEQVLSMGGDAQENEVVIPGLPPSATSQWQPEGRAQDLTVRDTVPSIRGGVLTLKRLSDADMEAGADPLGGTLIPAGAVLCASDDDGHSCRRDSPRLTWTLKRNKGVLTGVLRNGNEDACPLPPLGKVRNPSLVSRRLFPLATYGRPGCEGTGSLSWDEREPADELLYWKETAPTWRERLMFWRTSPPQLYLLPTNYGRTLRMESGGHVKVIRRRPVTLHLNEEAKISVDQISPAAALPTSAPGDDNFARLQERRSFLVRYQSSPQGPSVDLFLDTPKSVMVEATSHPQLSITSESASPESLVGGSQIAGFNVLGKPTAAGLLGTIRLARQVTGAPESCRDQPGALLVQGVTGTSCARQGRWFALGDPSRVLAKVRISPIAVPGAWIAAIFALCLSNLLIRDALRVPVPARIVLGFAEIFLVLRVLVAFEASVVDARREETVAGAWLALLWLPLAFELIPSSAAPAVIAWGARAAKVVVVVAGTVLVAGAGGVPGGLLGSGWLLGEMGKSVLVSAVLCLPAWWLLHGTAAGSAGVEWLRGRLKLTATQAALPARVIPGWSYGRMGALALLLILALHLGLGLGGIKEQIPGLGVHIAALLIPLLVLVWAHWFALVKSHGGRQGWWQEALALLLPFSAYVPFAMIHDTGAYIYFFALALWLSTGAWPLRARDGVLWVALGGLMGSGVLLLAGLGLGSLFRPLLVPAGLGLLASGALCLVLLPPLKQHLEQLRGNLASIPALAVISVLCAMQVGGQIMQDAQGENTAVPTWQDVGRIKELSGNAIRLLDLLAPQTVESLGVRTAYESRVAMAEMLQYGSTATGAGWLRIREPDALKNTHVDDNVTAVHLLGPFGRTGGLGVALLLLGFVAGIYALADSRPLWAKSRAQLGAMMLSFTSLYMLLANVAQVPFTGRNFYFLAVASHSDLLEGGLLLVIVLSAFGQERELQDV